MAFEIALSSVERVSRVTRFCDRDYGRR